MVAGWKMQILEHLYKNHNFQYMHRAEMTMYISGSMIDFQLSGKETNVFQQFDDSLFDYDLPALALEIYLLNQFIDIVQC